MIVVICCFFFFNDTATTEIYTLSLHDALPISNWLAFNWSFDRVGGWNATRKSPGPWHFSPVFDSPDRLFKDRKSTRLNSSHANISYAVFCLKKKKKHCRLP